MSVKNSCSEAVTPRRSVAAGCSCADACMRLYLLQAIDAIIHQWPSVILGFVEDLQIMAVGRPLQVSLTLAGAVRIVKDELETVGNLILHPGKQVLVTSDGPTTKQVLRRLPQLRKATAEANNLGIVCSPARAATGKFRRIRLQSARTRIVKIKKLKRAGANTGGLVYAGPFVWGYTASTLPD